jgi:pimeloyl-ACP methyl ester carboxylesterase
MSTPGTKPREDRVLTRPDGRQVAWSQWGTDGGRVVVFLHRNPGSRLLDPDPAATAKVCLVTLDRPGYGRTDPVPDPTRADVAADVAAVADAIDGQDVAVIGWSGGGIFALEAAALLGDRVRSLSLVCTPAPDDEIKWIPDEFRPLAASVPADPRGALAELTTACRFYADAPDALIDSDPGAADAEVRSRPGIGDALTVMMREGARQGAIGMASDIVAGSRGDPLPLDAVRAPARLWYGDADWVGPEHGQWYAQRLDTAQLTIVPDAGHLLPLTQWGSILESAG